MHTTFRVRPVLRGFCRLTKTAPVGYLSKSSRDGEYQPKTLSGVSMEKQDQEGRDFRWEPRPIHAYCAACGWSGHADKKVGCSVQCSSCTARGSNRYYAKVVSGDSGEWWLKLEWWLLRYAMEWSPRRRGRWAKYFHDHVVIYMLCQLIVLGLAIAIVSTEFHWIFMILGLVFAVIVGVDVLLVNTSIVFVSRIPSNSLRSVTLSFFAFVLIALVYSVFYLAMASAFVNLNTWFDAIYFSFITITTVGYGDIHVASIGAEPLRTAAQLIIISEILTGLYFLATILATLVQWTNATEPWEGWEV
jgi:hypothetical protein